jgi:hypothetical protein
MSFLKKLWESIKNLFTGLEVKSKVWVHVAVDVVQALKAIMDTPVPDVLTAIIPGNIDDKAKDKIREWIPKILLQLNMIEAIADMTNVNDQLNAILAKMKLSSDEAKNIVWHGLASLIIEKLSDGKFSWADAIAVSQYYYDHILGTHEAVTPAQVSEVSTTA